MKYSIIEEMYYNGRCDSENVQPSSNYNKIIGQITELYNKLLNTLSEEQKKDFEKLNELQMGAEAESALTHYKEGLKIGLLLFAECLKD